MATPAFAQTPAELKIGMDTVWVLITASLVFFMNLGFALVESGFCRAKNTVNILSKNFIVFAISCLAFYVFGWGLMFGNGTGFIGLEGLFTLGGADNSPATGHGVSRRVQVDRVDRRAAECEVLLPARLRRHRRDDRVGRRRRAHQVPLVHRVLVPARRVRVSRSPATGSGAEAGSRRAGFWDFAGSTVVHSVGGWAALAGILILGPRLGKYGPNGKVNADSAAQLHVRRDRLLRPVARLVRVQSGLDDGG